MFSLHLQKEAQDKSVLAGTDSGSKVLTDLRSLSAFTFLVAVLSCLIAIFLQRQVETKA